MRQEVKEKSKIFGLYGAGGFAREVMPFVAVNISWPLAQVFFIETQPTRAVVNNRPVLSEKEFLAQADRDRYFNIAISDSKVREDIAQRCLAGGAEPLSLRAPQAVIYENNKIGEGAIFCAFTMVTSNAQIGRFFHANIYSYIAHDCVIGDFVTFAPHVQCNGNVHIHDHATIGTGAILKQGTSAKPLVIGQGAVVGMGAVVTKDVPPFTTVIGNPARAVAEATGCLARPAS